MQQILQQYHNPPPNYNLIDHKTHGFSNKLSLPQFSAYVVIAFSIVIYFTCNFTIASYTVSLVLFILALATLIISSAIATCTDPTDRVVYYYKWTRHDKTIQFLPEYDKVLFCQFCDSYCMANSKHCRNCNRCVTKFDHHCVWFNNCVGDRNYKEFMVSILSTFTYTIVIVVHTIIMSIQKVDYYDENQLLKVCLAWLNSLIMLIFGFLLFNLIVLHCYLQYTGQTTYNFLQRKKREEEIQRRQAQNKKQAQSNTKILPLNNNKSQQSYTNVAKPILNEENISRRSQGKMDMENSIKVQNKQHQIENIFYHSQEEKTEKQKDKIEDADITVIKQTDNNQDETIKLPNFFKKNRSLKVLLPSIVEVNQPKQIPRNLNRE